MKTENESKQLKILMVDSLDGNEYAIELCNGLHEAGVDIRLATLADRTFEKRPSFPILPLLPSKRQKFSQLKKSGQYIAHLWTLLNVIRREKIDAVHYQFFRRERIEPFFLLLLRLLNVKIIYTAHNIVPHEHSRIDFWLKRLVYTVSHHIIVHSKYIEDKLHRIFPFTQGNSSVIPHGNFDNYLPERPITKGEAIQQLGLPADAQLLLFFGYLREYKGVDLLVEAFEQAGGQNGRLHLIIAGRPHSATLTKKLHQMIELHPHGDRIMLHDHFIPNEDVATYFSAADAIVLPYRHIDHSGIIHLAYSFGKAVIATAVGDFPEAVEHQKSGLLLPPNDVACLAEVITEATAQPKLLAQMGEYGRFLSESKYSWRDIARKTCVIYQLTAVPATSLG